MRNLRSIRTVVVAVLAVTALTACSGSSSDTTPSAEDLQSRLDHAKTVLDAAASIAVTMSTDSLPSGVTGLLDAEGVGTHAPAFQGTVKVATAGASVSADLVSVNGSVYAKLGFSPVFVPLDPASYGAPDPATLLDTDHGVSAFLTATQDAAGGEQTREGDQVLTAVSGTLPGEAVAAVLPAADANGTFDVEYRLSDEDVLRTAVITGPFYGSADDVTYSLTLEPSDSPVDISPP